jgi:hypothetical protein
MVMAVVPCFVRTATARRAISTSSGQDVMCIGSSDYPVLGTWVRVRLPTPSGV